jgi:Ca2+-binding RTX toxin-like protein
VDYWQFNEGGGASTTNYNPAADQVGTITDNNKAGLNPVADLSPTWTTGRNGSTALEFHGVGGTSAQRDGGWLALAPSATEALAGQAASKEASLSFWIKTTQVGSNIGWDSPSVIGTENNGGIADIQWGSINAAGQIGLGMRDDAGVMSTKAINDGVWHQVVVTHDFATGATLIFVDGVQDAAGTFNPGIIVPNNFLGLGVTADDGGAAHRFLNGTLEDVRIYDQTLTASQIQAIYETELMGNQSNVIANDGQTIRFALDVHDAVSTVLSGLVSGTVVSSGVHSALVDASGTVDISGWNATEVALSDYGSGSYMITVSATNARNGTVSKQLSVVNDSDSVVGTAAADSLVGNANHNVLAGGDGNDVLSGLAGNDMLIGGTGDDRLIGGAGSDALTGGLGSDTFAWSLADQGTVAIPARDTITDFSPAAQAAGGDVLDLRDLLPSATDAATLDNYLNFSKSGLDTVIDVRPTGAAGGVTQQIVLSNVDLTASGTLNDVAIIQDLLTKGKLLTD